MFWKIEILPSIYFSLILLHGHFLAFTLTYSRVDGPLLDIFINYADSLLLSLDCDNYYFNKCFSRKKDLR